MNNLKFKKGMKWALQWAFDIAIAVVVALFITKFIVTHTFVPTGSMIPTIAIDDHLMINRVPMYYRDPKPGEIVVFHEGGKELIKRVIAVPGDVYDIKDGNVYINGVQLDEPYLNEENSTFAFMMEDLLPLTLPEDQYFLMGDNRNNSEDSRYFGMVHRKAIYAKSWFRIWPLNRLGNIK